mmetsp:Transcript_24234/g.27468  ORF Transcript_24234/g.27468 Transcript_24234/m.27468 type:complete len:249 (+) Transcript_24234:912-1658(+)
MTSGLSQLVGYLNTLAVLLSKKPQQSATQRTSLGRDRRCLMTDLDTGFLVHRIDLHSFPKKIRNCPLSPQKCVLVAMSSDKIIKIDLTKRQVTHDEEEEKGVAIHGEYLRTFEVSKNYTIASGGQPVLQLFDRKSNDLNTLQDFEFAFMSLHISAQYPDLCYAGDQIGRLYMIALPGLEIQHRFRVHKSRVLRIIETSEGILTTSNDTRVCLLRPLIGLSSATYLRYVARDSIFRRLSLSLFREMLYF